MGIVRSALPALVLAGTLGLIAFILTYRLTTTQDDVASRVRMTGRSISRFSNPVRNLEVSLEGMSLSPLVIRAVVTNLNCFPVTVVSYDSPLDTLAFKLGLLSVTPRGSSSPLPLPVIEVRRIWPPPADALVTIAPGQSVVNEIVLSGPTFEEKLLDLVSSASVTLIGRWEAVWIKDKGSIHQIALGSLDPDPDVYNGPFVSNSLDIMFNQGSAATSQGNSVAVFNPDLPDLQALASPIRPEGFPRIGFQTLMDSPRGRPSGIPRLSRLPVPRSSIPRPASTASTNPSLHSRTLGDSFGGGELNSPKVRTSVTRDPVRAAAISSSNSPGGHESLLETVALRDQPRSDAQRGASADVRVRSTSKRNSSVPKYQARALATVTRPEAHQSASPDLYADDPCEGSRTQPLAAQNPKLWPPTSLEQASPEKREIIENGGTETQHDTVAPLPPSGARRIPSQASLAERTIETLAQIPSSPALSKKSSTFFEQARSISRAESGSSRPGSSHILDGPGRPLSRKSSRPGSSGGQDGPSTPDSRASGFSFKNSFSTISATPQRAPANGVVKTPQTKTVIPFQRSVTSGAKLAPSGILPVLDVARSPSPSPSQNSVGAASLNSSPQSITGRPVKPRSTAAAQGLFKKQSLPALKGLAVSADGMHAPETVWDGSVPRAKSPAAVGTHQSPALTNRKSSAALREQIARAKAAKRAALRQTTPELHGSTTEDQQHAMFHDEFNAGLEHEDPFNLRKSEQPGSKVLQQRIASARASGRLNIAALGLKDIPQQVMNMYNFETVSGQGGNWAESVDLTRLVGADNEIEQLDDGMFPDKSLDSFNDDDDDGDCQGNIFGGLETLDLHGNLLSAVPLGFRRLVHLTSLNLSSNKLENNSLAIISQMTSLRDLKLSKNLLSGPLDPALLNLGALEMIDLHGNNISALPPHMDKLSRLRIINMNENRLETIPFDSFCKLPLTELCLRRNRLTGVLIQQPIEALAHLQILDVSANHLTHLVPEGSKLSLPDVHSVSLSINRLQSLPDIASWTSLLTLSLDENHIVRIPEGFMSLPKLRYADLSSNEISIIPPEIARMQGLTMLRLSGNPLRDRKLISASTDELKGILAARLEPPPPYQEPNNQSITIGYGRNVSEADDKLQKAPELSSTAVHDDDPRSDAEDDFTTPPTSAPQTPTRLRSETVVKDVWFVKPGGLLDLSRCDMRSLNPQTCSAVAAQNQVRQIQLHHNPITVIPVSLTAFGSTLSVLSLAHAQLAGESYLTEPLELPALRELSIMSNQVTSLDPLTQLLKAPMLEKIDASLNRLASLPSNLQQAFPQLSVLLAPSNQLTQLEPDSIRGLRIVDASGNDIGHLNPRLGLLGGVGGLQRLDVTGNRFKVPRWSILEQGTETTLRWLRGRLPVEEMATWRLANGEEVGDDVD
ncbi:hypothetical protein E4U21_006318 [Claviceps maximensis]|nr:hypothetical protein E4U21_006318 [Claviceps maximensis]